MLLAHSNEGDTVLLKQLRQGQKLDVRVTNYFNSTAFRNLETKLCNDVIAAKQHVKRCQYYLGIGFLSFLMIKDVSWCHVFISSKVVFCRANLMTKRTLQAPHLTLEAF